MIISRRKFLVAGGAVMALPALPSLATAAANKASKPAKKLVMMYVPNGLNRRGFFPGEENGAVPIRFKGGFSADKTKDKRTQNKPGVYPFELTSTMQPLKDIKSEVTLVTGMDRTYKNGQDVHAQAASCYLTSVSPEQAAARGWKNPNGRSLDQIVGDHVGASTAFRTLEISCNGFRAGIESIHFNNISWYGPDRIAPSIKDPRKLYDRLFSAGGQQEHINEVSSLMVADAKTLSKTLAHEDRHTLDEFMTMIRNIEVRIKKLQEMLAGASIKEPTEETLPRGDYIKLQADMMLLALQMGLTNVSTFMIGPERWEATLLYEDLFPKPVNHHQFTHNQQGEGYKRVQKIDVFHMQLYHYILSKMKAIKEVDGTSMLDNSIVTYGAGMGDGATHQYYDMPLIVAGKAQGQIKQGRFIQCKSGTLNSNMWLTIAQLMGVKLNSFADSSGVISDLWN
jgi:hypothetical protein